MSRERDFWLRRWCKKHFGLNPAHPVASWFETRGVAALLTMRV
jgi:hypothetical protein